jgi:hypothetical protein
MCLHRTPLEYACGVSGARARALSEEAEKTSARRDLEQIVR